MLRSDIRAYSCAIARYWWIIAIGTLLSVFSGAQSVIQSFWKGFVMPVWIWLIILFVSLSIAQFLAWRKIKSERDELKRYDVGQNTLSSLAEQRDWLISHQNKRPATGTELGAWIEQFNAKRLEIGKMLKDRLSQAEFRAYDHIGLFISYAVEPVATLSNEENQQFMHWRSRIARDHKWLERLILDYGRYRFRVDPTAIAAFDPSEIEPSYR